jgi:F-type H+-transporting ATPase subunit delta
MAEPSTLARPYAEAVFRLAQEHNELALWGERLANAALLVDEPQMAALIADPGLDDERVVELMLSMLDGAPQTANFLRLLAANDRLPLLPEVAAQFDVLRAAAEGVLEARIISAQPLDEAQVEALVTALKSRFNREVQASVTVDESLLGGAIISIGDRVIDGSVRGRLQKMAFALSA